VVDTSASPTKKVALKSGDDLSQQVQANRRLITDFIDWRRLCPPQTDSEHTFVLVTIANLAGLHLLPEGLFRTWNYKSPTSSIIFGATVAPDQISGKIIEIGKLALFFRSIKRDEDKLTLVARIEWELGIGPLHPFYDGCGRISRYFSTLTSLWSNTPLVIHHSREEYFSRAREGETSFVQYYLNQPRVASEGRE